MDSKQIIEQYLSTLPEEQMQICRELHKKVLKNMSGAHSMIYHNALGYATSASASDRVVYIAPQSAWVNLGFFFGSDIPDPEQLLIGQGKRMRHIKIRTLQEAKNPANDTILKTVWAKAQADIYGIHGKK